MAIEYLGLSSINGPLIVLEGVQDAFFDEIVEFVVNGNERKLGRIIEIYEDKAVIQVFEGTENMSLLNTHTKLTGHPMEIALSPDMLGRTFNGIGQPIDDLGPITSTLTRDINGLPLNPVKREYPRNYIRTGISAIDGLTTLIRGQKLPIFSGNGLPHDQLAAQIVKQASLGDDSDEEFAIVFAAMGVKHDVAEFFQRTFEESGVSDHVVMFLNLANDPVVERLITPKVALTVAEYLAFEQNKHILVILTDMTSFAEAAIPPHSVQEWHSHCVVDETLVVLSGAVVVHWLENGETMSRTVPQDAILKVGRAVHTIENPFENPSDFLVFRMVPDGADKREQIKNDKVLLEGEAPANQ